MQGTGTGGRDRERDEQRDKHVEREDGKRPYESDVPRNMTILDKIVNEQETHPYDLSDIQRGKTKRSKTYKRIKTSGTQTESGPEPEPAESEPAEPEPAESEPAPVMGLPAPTTHRSRPKWRDACDCCGKDCTSKPDNRRVRRCRDCKKAGIFPPSKGAAEAEAVAAPVEDPVVETAAEAEAVAAPGSPYQRLSEMAEEHSPPKIDLLEEYTNPLGTPQNILNQGEDDRPLSPLSPLSPRGEDDDPLDPLPSLSPPPEIAKYSQLKKKKKKKKKKPKKTKKKKPKKSKKKKPKKSKKKK